MKKAFVEIATDGPGRFVLAIASAAKDGDARIDRLEIKTPPLDPVRTVKDFVSILREYKVNTVMADRHATHWARQQFQQRGISFEFCGLVRPDLRRDILAALEFIELPDDPQVAQQLAALQQRQRGHGGPDDLIVACGGAALLALGAIETLKEDTEYA